MRNFLLLSCLMLASINASAYNAPGKWQLHFGNQIPANALVVGYQSDHSPLYLCQAGVILGGVQPGKTWSNYTMCNVPFAGQEKLQRLYSLFVVDPDQHHAHHWIHYNGQPIASHAFAVGHEQDGKVLYLCRAKIDGGMQPGKTWAGYNGCNVPYGGQEKVIRPSELFVWGHRHHHQH